MLAAVQLILRVGLSFYSNHLLFSGSDWIATTGHTKAHSIWYKVGQNTN
jgi:hypothetical protein